MMLKYNVIVLCYGWFQSPSRFITEIHSAGGRCMLVNMFAFCLSSYNIAVKSLLTVGSISPWFMFSFFSKSKHSPFQFDLTVSQQFILLVTKPLYSSRDEAKLCVESLYPTHLHYMCGYHCSSHAFPVYAKYTIILCISLRITHHVNFHPKLFLFLWHLLSEDGSAFKEHSNFSWTIIFSICIIELMK
jgi:hypothetical protein